MMSEYWYCNAPTQWKGSNFNCTKRETKIARGEECTPSRTCYMTVHQLPVSDCAAAAEACIDRATAACCTSSSGGGSRASTARATAYMASSTPYPVTADVSNQHASRLCAYA